MAKQVVTIGAGPGGLWNTIQWQKRVRKQEARRPVAPTEFQLYERHTEYKRSHVLRLDHWSMLLYAHQAGDVHERRFYEAVIEGGYAHLVNRAPESVYIRTNELEKAEREYCLALGANINYTRIESPRHAMDLHPHCDRFIAADGARSSMRDQLLKGEPLITHDLQHIVELKYQTTGRGRSLHPLSDHYKANKLLNFMVFEYVGREKEGVTPVTLRVFIDKETYNAIPEATFAQPLKPDSPNLPPKLAQDISTYLNVREAVTGESYQADSGNLSKLKLSMYASPRFAFNEAGKVWILGGDAPMGVPYFRSLNQGIILANRMAQIFTTNNWPVSGRADRQMFFYDTVHRPLHVRTEFAIAQGKDGALHGYDKFRRLNAALPWQVVGYSNDLMFEYQTQRHRAVMPAPSAGS